MTKSSNRVGRRRLWRAPGASLLGVGTALLLLGCSWKDEDLQPWQENLENPRPVGLRGSVVLHDEGLERLLFLTSKQQNSLETSVFSSGKNVTAIRAAKDLSQLFVLSRGVYPRVNPDDEPPQLRVFDGGTEPQVTDTFVLDNPMSQLALDPKGEWVAAFAGDATVTNPNELVLLELGAEDSKPASKTIRSFGGSPKDLLFTDELSVPFGVARRFMVVRTDRDLTLVDLSDLARDEITVRLPETPSGVAYSPEQIVYDDGEEDDDTDARIAVRLAGTSDVVLLQLGRSDDEAKDFSVVVNIVDVGGVPSTIDFVRTDGGLRLAALVPAIPQATLVNPETTLAEEVELPSGFSRMTRITNEVGGSQAGGDVALLWGATEQIAFWSLGSTSSTPFRSVDATDLDVKVSAVLDVPAPNQHLKVLVGQGKSVFYVLDLEKRQSSPLHTNQGSMSVTPSTDGQRLWVTGGYSNHFSAVFLEQLHPAEFYVQPLLSSVFDIERADEGRSLIALHSDSNWAATVMDAENPDSAVSAYYPALYWEDMQ